MRKGVGEGFLEKKEEVNIIYIIRRTLSTRILCKPNTTLQALSSQVVRASEWVQTRLLSKLTEFRS